MPVTLVIRANFDERQRFTVGARTEESLLANVEKMIRKEGKHNCDGWTLGEPEEGEPYVEMSYSESGPEEYRWELYDRSDPDDERRENGSFEEVFELFWEMAIIFLRNGNKWVEES